MGGIYVYLNQFSWWFTSNLMQDDADSHLKNLDPEIFDDDDFYHQVSLVYPFYWTMLAFLIGNCYVPCSRIVACSKKIDFLTVDLLCVKKATNRKIWISPKRKVWHIWRFFSVMSTKSFHNNIDKWFDYFSQEKCCFPQKLFNNENFSNTMLFNRNC